MRAKRVLSLLLVVAMLLSLATSFVQAASTPEEALGEVNIFNGGQSLNCLAVNGRVQELNYVYYRYVGVAGTREIPAYCVNPTDAGVPQKVPAGQSIAYMAKERTSDPKIMGIVSNGYPTKSLGELGLQSKVEGYYATKIALWCYIIPGWNISNVTVNPSLSGSAKTQAERVLAAAKKIYQNGSWWTSVPTAGLTTTADKEYAYPVTIDGEAYKQQIFTVHSETWVCDYAVNVAFADPSAVPSGTRIVDLNNRDIMTITTKNTGKGYDGQFKILYPADSIAGESGSVQFTLRAQVYQHGVYYATCAEVNKYGKVQNYICDTDPTRNTDLSAVSKYGSEPTTDTPDTSLEIIKVEEGTDVRLAGAVFQVVGLNGDKIGSFSTGNDGRIMLPLTESGTYIVTEITPPKAHLLSANPTQTVTVSYGETATVTFENAPYGNLRVEKISDTGDVLEGVTVQVKHIESGTTYSQKTGPGGAAVFEQLQPGAYEVKELAGIPGWKADTDTVKTISVTTGETSVVTLKNKELPGLRILKYDRATMKALPDVFFEIFHDAKSLGVFTTDQMGEIFLPELEPGTYRVEERRSDDSHILDMTPREIELTAGDGIRELVFFNDKKPGMHLVKIDSENPSKVIPNAVFEIKAVDDSFGPKEFTTLADGTIDLSKLDPGAYVVTEKSCNGYIVDNAQRIIQLRPNEDAEFVFTNSIRPSMQLVKLSSDGTPLSSVTFRIARIEDGSHYLDRTTNAQGEIMIADLEPGVYSVRETATTAEHILDVREYHVELFPGKTSTLIIENQKRPHLIVYKHDADTGEPIADTVFEVRAADGHSVDQIKTDKDGRAELKNLLPGIYEIIEKSVPAPYLLDAPKQMATLYANRDHTVYFENHKKPSLTIQKVDSVTGSPIKGAKFQVWYASNHTASGELNDLGIFYSDENGQFSLSGLRDGWYKVTELEPAAGFAIKDPATQEVFVRAGEGKTLTFENTPLNAIIVQKYDSVTHEALAGATFQLRYLGGTSGTGGTVIGQKVTGQNGVAMWTGLKSGTYVVEEVSAADGYTVTDASETVFLAADGEQSVISVRFGNAPDGSLLIRKVCSVNPSVTLQNAEFKVAYADGSVVGDSNGIYRTDENGEIRISGLKPGKSVVVTETRAPDGYILDTQSQTIQVKEGKTVSLTFKNQPKGQLIIQKRDSVTNKPLPGAEFRITTAAGCEVGVDGVIGTATMTQNGIFVTDSNGEIRITNLNPGTYVLTEIKAPDGYSIDHPSTNVTIGKGGDTQIVVVKNTAKSGILIHKIDAGTKKGIYGATFLLYDSGRNPIGQYASDQRGYVYIDDLPGAGRYYLRELENEGYIVDEQMKTVYVKSGQTTEVEWKNTAITAQIQVVKKSADYNPTNGLPAGTLLEGAVFEIYDKAGNLVDTIRSNSRGLAVSRPLPLSRYTIREVKAPEHYGISTEELTAYLEHEGQIVRFEVADKSLSTGVSINKTGPKEIVAGQPVRYVFTGIANTSNVRLDNFYWRDTLPAEVRLANVVTGTYNYPGVYKIIYRVNGGSYRTLADNLNTRRNYTLNASAVALGLAANERVTEIMFVFGQAPAGFAQVERPHLYCTAISSLPNASFVNVADVGGTYNGLWVQATSRWVTKVYVTTVPKLPKTGY